MAANPSSVSTMASSELTLSAEQFSFCKMCRLNHTNSKSHTYSRRHQQTIAGILKRFSIKVDEMISVMASPQIEDEHCQPSTMVWCYFCEKNVAKHHLEDGITILCWGLATHLKSVQHMKSCKRFWWQNRVDQNALLNYVISENQYDKFKEKVTESVAEYKLKRRLQMKADVEHILLIESERLQLVQNCRSASEGTSGIDKPNVSAAGPPQISEDKLNIFTGMRPPWLQDSESSSSTRKPVHPNMDDFERSRKHNAKLPDRRVGAYFDREAVNSPDWLPSFGRVWNNGRRLATRKQFDTEPRQQKRQCTRDREVDPAVPRSAMSRPPPNLNKYIL